MPESANGKLYGWAGEMLGGVARSEWEYAELDVTTNFSFLRGASHPDELVRQAAGLGYRAMGVTDVNSLAGVVRAYEAAKKVEGFQLVVGARLVFGEGEVLVWPGDGGAYARLCELLTVGRRRAPKGECHLVLEDLLERCEGMWAGVCLAGERRLGEVSEGV